MRLNKIALAIAACGACAALPALSQDRPYYDNDARYQRDREWRDNDWRDRGRHRDDVARVIDARPVAGSGQREECWNPRAGHYEEVRGPDKAKVLSKDTAIGAVAGGVIGHQIDSGAAGTIGGALLGGLAGHAYEQHQNNQEQQDDLDRSRCRVVADASERSFDVRYRYRGEEHVARLDHQPGATLVPGRDIDDDGNPYQRGEWHR